MLVLSRKPGEKIMIGGNIVLEFLKSCGNRVRLGICAPREVSVVRSELQESASENFRGSSCRSQS